MEERVGNIPFQLHVIFRSINILNTKTYTWSRSICKIRAVEKLWEVTVPLFGHLWLIVWDVGGPYSQKGCVLWSV
ncbi:hypothetical protein AKJ16_DCAP02417 [Drosera capensis]